MPTCPSCQSLTGLSTLSCPSCGSNLTLDPGTLIAGRYEILERLGRGGMGTVYRAKDRDLDQNVAIKFVPVGSHPQAVARFKSEIKLARKVKPPQRLRGLANTGRTASCAYIVMELRRGAPTSCTTCVKEQGPPGLAKGVPPRAAGRRQALAGHPRGRRHPSRPEDARTS